MWRDEIDLAFVTILKDRKVYAQIPLALVEDRPVSAADLMATVYLALGLDPKKQNPSNVNRPIRLADPSAEPVKEALA